MRKLLKPLKEMYADVGTSVEEVAIGSGNAHDLDDGHPSWSPLRKRRPASVLQVADTVRLETFGPTRLTCGAVANSGNNNADGSQA